MAELHFFQLFKKKCILAIFNTLEMRAIIADLVQNADMTYFVIATNMAVIGVLLKRCENANQLNNGL